MSATRSLHSLTRLFAIAIVVAVAVVGWLAIDSVEADLSASTRSATSSLQQVERSIQTSSDLANATADALDAAAVSLDSAAVTSEATGQVASDIADVTASLRPVVRGTGDALGQIDGTLSELVSVIDSLPFGPDVDTSPGTLGRLVDDIEPLEADLLQAETALRGLSDEVEELSPDSKELAVQLRRVAQELRASSSELVALADDVADTRSSVGEVLEEQEVNLFPLQLMLSLICLAVMLTNIAGFLRRDSSQV